MMRDSVSGIELDAEPSRLPGAVHGDGDGTSMAHPKTVSGRYASDQ